MRNTIGSLFFCRDSYYSAGKGDVYKRQVHIRHIREKIEINPREPKYLKVVWGVGYKIEKQ